MKLMKLALAAAVAVGLAAPASAVTKLAFALDESGSVSNTEFDQIQNGLANALAQIPTDGTYEITVVTFDHVARSHVGLTNRVIDSVATLNDVRSKVQNLPNAGGGTSIQTALDLIAGTNVGAGDTGLINVVTDGVSTGFNNASVKAAGWDGLSFEAVTNAASTAPLLPEAYAGANEGGVLIPSGGAVPDPRNQGFVLEVENFTDFENAIGSKIQAIVNPNVIPLPAGLPLVLTGMVFIGGLRAAKRRKAA